MKSLRQVLPGGDDRPLKAAAAGAAALGLSAGGLRAAEPAAKLAEILEKLPADQYESAQASCENLLDGGPAVIAQLVELVGDQFGDPQGVKPKYALHGLVMYASRPGAERERKTVAETLARELQADHSHELKAFICRQLQLCGRPEEVPALSKLLADERLCEPATQALLAIRGETALEALRRALPGAEGPRKATIRQAVDILSGE